MKKFTALFLVFCLMMLSVNLYAKKRRGAKLSVSYECNYISGGTPIINLQIVKGELISVNGGSLLLFLSSKRVWIPLNIMDIVEIRILKIPKVLKGAGKGSYYFFHEPLFGEKTIRFEGMTDSEIQETMNKLGKIAREKRIEIEVPDSELQEVLDKLRNKARIRDYK